MGTPGHVSSSLIFDEFSSAWADHKHALYGNPGSVLVATALIPG
jgi:hypothetical protein